MMRANRSTLVKLCLLTALAIPAQRSIAAGLAQNAAQSAEGPLSSPQLIARSVVAQADGAVPEFQAPASLTDGETLLIDGSSSMRTMNEALIEQFTSRYDSASVDSAASGTDTALSRLLDNEIDLAAIGRPLTEEEGAQGLVAVPIAREKIAIFVGPDNSFDGDITFERFSEIFRGDVTDWAEIDNGSGTGTIRFVDRPETSDTRLAFRSYPVFENAPFETGATADPVATDETAAVIDAIGSDGIGYAIANQVMGNPAVKIVSMHQTLPDDPRYPFSQPRSYVYVGEPSSAVQGFLAVATGSEGQAAIAQVQDAEGAAAAQLEEPAAVVTSPDGTLVARTDENNLAVIEDASGNLVAGPLAGAGGAVTALAFSEDGTTLATGTNTGRVRYWDTASGEPKGEAFPAVLGADNAVDELRFEGNDKLFVAGSQGRQGLWGLNGRSFGDDGAAAGVVTVPEAEGGFPWWLLLLPILGLVGAGLWLLSRNRNGRAAEPIRQTLPTATVTPPRTDPESDREVSSRAQTVISTDRVVDDSRSVTAPETTASPQPLPVREPDLADDSAIAEATFESTDLESPDLEGTNLDLLTPGGIAGAALGGAATLGGMAVATGDPDTSTDTSTEDDDDEDWDDNLDLSLDEASITPEAKQEIRQEIRQADNQLPTATLSAPDIPEPAVGSDLPLGVTTTPLDTTSVSDDDFWDAVPGGTDPGTSSDETPGASTERAESSFSNIDSIEPTRNTVIAETDTVLDIEPDQNTIIGDRAVIFGGAATAGAAIAAATAGLETLDTNSEEASERGTDDTSDDIDSFFSASNTTSSTSSSRETSDEPISTNDIANQELVDTVFAIIEPDVESDLSIFEDNILEDNVLDSENILDSEPEADPIVTADQQRFTSLEDLEESAVVEESTSSTALEAPTELETLEETLEGGIVTDNGDTTVSETDSDPAR